MNSGRAVAAGAGHGRVEVVTPSGAQVVDDPHRFSAAQQLFDQVRSDEPGATSDEIDGHYCGHPSLGRPGTRRSAFL